MLKIKDNVDLKELEKFDMKDNPSSECWLDDYYYQLLVVDNTNREINIDINTSSYGFDKDYKKAVQKATYILYNLIKADIVEKVDD